MEGRITMLRKLKTWEKAESISFAVVLTVYFLWLFYFILCLESMSPFAVFFTMFSLMFIAFPIAVLAVVVDTVAYVTWYLTGKVGDPPRPSLT